MSASATRKAYSADRSLHTLQFVRRVATQPADRLGSSDDLCGGNFIGDWLYLKNDPASRLDRSALVHSSSGRGLIAITWAPSPDPLPLRPSRPVFRSSRHQPGSGCHAFLRRFAHGSMETSNRSNAHGRGDRRSLLSFTFRLPLRNSPATGIAQRKAAQRQATASHEEVGRCWTTPRQTAEITRSANWEACFTLHIKKKCFALFRSVCGVCFPGHRAASHS